MPAIKSLDRLVQSVLRAVCIFLFSVLALILIANVLLRLGNDLSIFLDVRNYKGAAGVVKAIVPRVSMHWFDEIVELCFAALVFYGAAALWGLKGHFSVGDWISARLPNHALRGVYRLIVSLLSTTFIAVFFWYSLKLTRNATELSTVFQIPKSVMYSCMPVSSFIMLCYSAVDVLCDLGDLFGLRGGDRRIQESRSM